MRHCSRQVFGQVDKKRAAASHIDLLHAHANSQKGHLAMNELPHEHAVIFFPALGHESNFLMHRLAQTPRIEVQTAGKDEAVDLIQEVLDFLFLAQEGHDDGQPAGGEHRLGITGVEPQMGPGGLAGRDEININPDAGSRACAMRSLLGSAGIECSRPPRPILGDRTHGSVPDAERLIARSFSLTQERLAFADEDA